MRKLVLVAAIAGFIALSAAAMAATRGAFPKSAEPHAWGSVMSLSQSNGMLQSFSLRTPKQGEAVILVTPHTRYVRDGKPAPAGAIRRGERVGVTLRKPLANGQGTALTVNVMVPRPHVMGRVLSIKPTAGDLVSFTLQRPKAGVLVVRVTNRTRYYMGRSPGGPRDVIVGERVGVILGSKIMNGESTAAAVAIRMPAGRHMR